MKKHLPFLTGVYTTAPGLSRSEGNIFDVDESYEEYIANKRRCREEGIGKYFCTHEFSERTAQAVADFLQQKITTEYPKLLTAKRDFDSICSQIQEDVAVIQLEKERDWLAAIHLCSPNHWDPRTKIGKPFDVIHTPVPEIDRTVKNYIVMLKMIVAKEPFTRFAWGIATDDRLNHHPEPPPGYHAEDWRGRRVVDDNTTFFVRVEKQQLIGLKEVNAFIFTIRTYFYKVDELSVEEQVALARAVNSMTSASLEYKGMSQFKDQLVSLLAKGSLRDI
jgi:hypothetical protein